MNQVTLNGKKVVTLNDNKEIPEDKTPRCCQCGGTADYSPSYCEICFAYNYPKDYVRALTRKKYGKARYCKICRMMIKVQWHHYDYTKPYDAVPLCIDCHKNADENRDKSFDEHLGQYWRDKLIKTKLNKLSD